MFAGHPHRVIREECARALETLADPRAYAALDRAWGDADIAIENVAIHSAIYRDVPTMWSRFAPAIAAIATDPAAERIVEVMFFQCHGGKDPRRQAPERDPLLVEPRVIELAAQLRRHRRIGKAARACLGAVPLALATAAIAAHPLAPPAAAPAGLPSRRDYLARYTAGEHAVWDELLAHAGAIAQHADLRAEAAAVARALMSRVRHNADAVRDTLRTAGAQLALEHRGGSPDRLRALVGELPLALAAFWEVAGAVSLLPPPGAYDYGTCALQAEGIALLALDPLCLDGLADVDRDVADREAALAGTHPEILGPLWLPLAPDDLHKQNLSGGPPYAVELPAPSPADAVDPILAGTRTHPRLVAYLRHAFRWGGFALLELAARPPAELRLDDRIAFEHVRGDRMTAANQLLARLRANLIEF
jgi:hypothetical protein